MKHRSWPQIVALSLAIGLAVYGLEHLIERWLL